MENMEKLEGLNGYQKEYALAKAKYETLKKMMDEFEYDFIKQKDVKNPDGSVPHYTWTISNEQLSYTLSCEIEENPEYMKLWEQNCKAQNLLKEAEDNLIGYAMSVIPMELAEILKSVIDHPKYRHQLLNLAFRLDTSTLQKA